MRSTVARSGMTAKAPRTCAVTGSRFKDTRIGCALTVPQTAKLLRVAERTLHNWETGRSRVPYAAYKLLRILRGYELPGISWKQWRLVGDTLWTPEGYPIKATDAAWWSLLVRQARAFREVMAQLREARKPAQPAPALGLVPSKTSRTPNGQNPVTARLSGDCTWGHNGAIIGHGNDPEQAQPAAACAPSGRDSASGRRLGRVAQRLLPAGAGQLHPLAPTPQEHPGCAGHDDNSTATDAPQSRQKRPLLLRQRQESQALLPAVGGQQVAVAALPRQSRAKPAAKAAAFASIAGGTP